MNIDTHLFGSQRGYQCLAKSAGVSKSEDDALSQFGFGQSSDDGFLQGLAHNPTAFGRELPTGRYAVTRVLCGNPDVAGRATLEFRTLIFSREQFLRVRAAMPDLVSDRDLWHAPNFGAGLCLELPAIHAAAPQPSEWSWRIFDAWFSMQARRPHCILVEPELAGEVLKMPALIDAQDVSSFSWGIGLLRPVPWVDITILSPFGTPGTSRPAFGIARGQCVNPRIESARLSRPERLPTLLAIIDGGAVTTPVDAQGLARNSRAANRPRQSVQAREATLRQSRSALVLSLFGIACLAVLVGGVFWVTRVMTGVAAPIGVTATNRAHWAHVDVGWTEVPGATAYRVSRFEFQSQNGSKIEKERKVWELNDARSTMFRDTEVKPGLTYEYSVQALRATRESRFSVAAAGSCAEQPNMPRDLTPLVDPDTGCVKLKWQVDDPIDGKPATDYTVTRSGAGGVSTEVATGNTTPEWTDATGSPAVRYTYSVRAETEVGPSRESKPTTGIRRLETVAAPTVDAVTSENHTIVSWDSVTGATGFELIRTDATGALKEKRVNLPPKGKDRKIEYLDKDAILGVEYMYSVIAKAVGADSTPSLEVAGTRPFEPPHGLHASVDRVGEVLLTWTPPKGASYIDHYVVTRTNLASPALFYEEKIPLGSTSSWSDRKAHPGERYQYTIRAVTTSSTSIESDPATGGAIRGTGPLQATIDLADSVRITWTPLLAGTMTIERTATKEKPPKKSFVVSGDLGFYEDTTASPGVEYQYAYTVQSATGQFSPPSPAVVGQRLGSILSHDLRDKLKNFLDEVTVARDKMVAQLKALRISWEKVAANQNKSLKSDELDEIRTALENCGTSIAALDLLEPDLNKLVDRGMKANVDYKNAPGNLAPDRMEALVIVTAIRHLSEQCANNLLSKKELESMRKALTLRKVAPAHFQLDKAVGFCAEVDSKPLGQCPACTTAAEFTQCWGAEIGNVDPGVSTTEVHDMVSKLLSGIP